MTAPRPSDDPRGAHGGVGEDDLEIRLAAGDDLAGVLSVGHRTWLATYEPITGPEYVAMGLAKWWTPDVATTSIRQGRTLVAVDGDEVVGVATFGMQDGAFALWKLYVLPGHHGHGIGSRLMTAVVDRALELGHDRIVLSHIEGNRQAARFYAAHGFTETHRESGGSGLPVNVWMERQLTPPQATDASHVSDVTVAADVEGSS
ncbi:MAG TPA: GNAT family N-acetyltransferase [Humibacillus sp.]|nr:GNAT family N-acetyltransferase [Humibacillus sp.]